ncbi:MAG: PhzF family phenazine biosynthesis protein, partial [Pseudonocardiaceae bacterium]
MNHRSIRSSGQLTTALWSAHAYPIIDAFTDQPFAGKPAAVCLLDTEDRPDDNWMEQVAAEMNLAEAAFAHPLREGADAATGRCAGLLAPSTSTYADTPPCHVWTSRAPATEIAVPDSFAQALSAKPDAAYGTGAFGDLLAVFPTSPASVPW